MVFVILRVHCIENWSKLLKASEVPNLEMIVSSDFAIPIGNDFIERFFSVMNNLWTDKQNRLSINTVVMSLKYLFLIKKVC